MIQRIIMRGIKSANGAQELTGRDIIIGQNGAGKTTRAQALGVSLLGYVPGGGKLASETMKLAHGDSMTVGIETEAFRVTRKFEREGGAQVQQTITLNPPGGEKTATAKEKRIEQELGKLPVMLDFGEFLGLSDAKRREYIYELAGAEEDGMARADWQLTCDLLRERLALPDTADPEELQARSDDIVQCLEQYRDDAMLQEGLRAMYTYAKGQTSFWRKERDKAIGAAQKISEYKNDLAETDRNLDANNRRLEELRAQEARIVAELSQADKENERIETVNGRLAALRAEIAALESETNPGNPEALRVGIAQYTADLRRVDNANAIAATTAAMEAALAQVKEHEQAVEKRRDEFQRVKAKKDADTALLEKLRQQSGQCPIDCRIECDKDFSGIIGDLETENEAHAAEQNRITDLGINARAALDTAKQAVRDAQETIAHLRTEEVGALRENEQLQAIIREYEGELAKAET